MPNATERDIKKIMYPGTTGFFIFVVIFTLYLALSVLSIFVVIFQGAYALSEIILVGISTLIFIVLDYFLARHAGSA